MKSKCLKKTAAVVSGLSVMAQAFSPAAYAGYWGQSDQGDNTFTNPVIYADVPDPDIICARDMADPTGQTKAYYMTSTTMHMSPGVPIYAP